MDTLTDNKDTLHTRERVRSLLPRIIKGYVMCTNFSLFTEPKGVLPHKLWENLGGHSKIAGQEMARFLRDGGPAFSRILSEDFNHHTPLLKASGSQSVGTEEAYGAAEKYVVLARYHVGDMFVIHEPEKIRIGINGRDGVGQQFLVIALRLPERDALELIDLLDADPQPALTDLLDTSTRICAGRSWFPDKESNRELVQEIISPVKGITAKAEFK